MIFPDKRIIKFIKKHHVLTLATCINNQNWCSNCFYAFLEDDLSLLLTSDYDTRHVKEFLRNPEVSGSIVLETMIIGKIRGIQFTGIIETVGEDILAKTRSVYLKRFPYAALMETNLWILKINYIKMTDNRLGFGKKLIWERDKS